MAVVKYTIPFEVKNYETSRLASTLDRLIHAPRTRFLINTGFSALFGAIGIIIYNANGHTAGVIDSVLLTFSLIQFLIGCLYIPPLMRKLQVTERIACLAGKRQAQLPGRLIDLLIAGYLPKTYHHIAAEGVELIIGVAPDAENEKQCLFFTVIRPHGENIFEPVIHARGTTQDMYTILKGRRDEYADRISKLFVNALKTQQSSGK